MNKERLGVLLIAISAISTLFFVQQPFTYVLSAMVVFLFVAVATVLVVRLAKGNR